MLEEGDKAPDFTLKDQHGEKVKLSDHRKELVVLYFYPKANTGGCTTQACSIRDNSDEYAKAGAKVIGISPDEVKDISKFADKNDLEFTLVADLGHKVADKYGTWVEKSMYGNKYMGVQRATFIIRGMKILRVFPKVQPKKHDGLVLKALAEINEED
ncbi:MAG: thioredoxin-dependent thiol peroxidase [Solirubrobacterales bacterium]|nr:thioredoxin-dependent thiol peroxidase [Solirubrobacterales bacterium]MCB0859610.1 thioredoxin-dependent thiol peroxidase [Solirubrobacterales bacterium]HRV59358.1 thioredoxin-dependent thiol peroxidase [Solirubrobacterales bacterium]